MTSVTLRLKWCAAHRLLHHRGKCVGLHGHNFHADITVTANYAALTITGMVIDFAAVKGVVGKWIDDNWDHRPILNKDDSLLKADGGGRWLSPEELTERFGVRPFVMDCEPTAENMARFLFDFPWFPPPSPTTPYRVTKVTVWETDTCSATHGHEVPR